MQTMRRDTLDLDYLAKQVRTRRFNWINIIFLLLFFGPIVFTPLLNRFNSSTASAGVDDDFILPEWDFQTSLNVLDASGTWQKVEASIGGGTLANLETSQSGVLWAFNGEQAATLKDGQWETFTTSVYDLMLDGETLYILSEKGVLAVQDGQLNSIFKLPSAESYPLALGVLGSDVFVIDEAGYLFHQSAQGETVVDLNQDFEYLGLTEYIDPYNVEFVNTGDALWLVDGNIWRFAGAKWQRVTQFNPRRDYIYILGATDGYLWLEQNETNIGRMSLSDYTIDWLPELPLYNDQIVSVFEVEEHGSSLLMATQMGLLELHNQSEWRPVGGDAAPLTIFNMAVTADGQLWASGFPTQDFANTVASVVENNPDLVTSVLREFIPVFAPLLLGIIGWVFARRAKMGEWRRQYTAYEALRPSFPNLPRMRGRRWIILLSRLLYIGLGLFSVMVLHVVEDSIQTEGGTLLSFRVELIALIFALFLVARVHAWWQLRRIAGDRPNLNRILRYAVVVLIGMLLFFIVTWMVHRLFNLSMLLVGFVLFIIWDYVIAITVNNLLLMPVQRAMDNNKDWKQGIEIAYMRNRRLYSLLPDYHVFQVTQGRLAMLTHRHKEVVKIWWPLMLIYWFKPDQTFVFAVDFLTDIMLKKGYEDRAVALMEFGIQSSPKSRALYYSLADNYLQKEVHPERAFELCLFVSNNAANNSDWLMGFSPAYLDYFGNLLMAWSLSTLQRFDEAEMWIKTMFSPYPGRDDLALSRAYYIYARIQQLKGNLAEALKSYKQAVELDSAGLLRQYIKRPART
ncbi:MAG: hypothetical protein OHK0046_45100 [Anaerolineae bacterium]